MVSEAAAPTEIASDLEHTTLRAVRWRLLPFLFLLYVVAWIDRSNIGFAALQMNQDLRLSPAAYGFGAGILALGYALCEVPSTLVLYRVGARRWIARIMITWGILSATTMFVRGPSSLYVLRFLLGVAEAGFFPGMIFYLSSWFPSAERARTLSWFLAAIPLSSVVGGPSAGALLGLDGDLGLRGWQWLFLAEGLPAIVLGIVVLMYLPDRPSDARWLSPDASRWLEARLAREQGECRARHRLSLRNALAHPAVWQLGMIYFAGSAASYGLALWVPQMLRGLSGLSDIMIGVVAALPYLAGTVATLLVGSHSDKTGERCLHTSACYIVGAVGFIASALARSPTLAIFALTIAAVGTFGRNAPFWAMPSAFLAGEAAAGGIALINTLGALGGFSGPYIIGVVKGVTGSVSGGFIVVALLLLVGAWMVARLRRAPALAIWHPVLPAAEMS
jgi:MFS transporter, ACS family, tartrate transporter